MRPLNPAKIAAPLALYSHGVELPAGLRIVCTSGQLGIAPDGTIPESVAEQAGICFANIKAILAEGGMTVDNICHVSSWLTNCADHAAYMAAPDTFLSGVDALPASTLLVIAGFSRPQFKVEIEVTAVAP